MTPQTMPDTTGYTDGYNARSDAEAVRIAALFMATNDIETAIEVLTGRVEHTANTKRAGG